MPHTLVLLRHASAASLAPSDAERGLTPRGHAEARAAGRWLAASGVVPSAALVSDVVRARTTWEEAARAAGWSLAPELDPGLYSADTDTALDLVRGVAAEVDTLVVVGHNPTIASLSQLLDDGEGPAATDVLRHGFPPASAAIFEVTCDWADLDLGCARLVAFRPGAPE